MNSPGTACVGLHTDVTISDVLMVCSMCRQACIPDETSRSFLSIVRRDYVDSRSEAEAYSLGSRVVVNSPSY